jgi:hypothetical protein
VAKNIFRKENFPNKEKLFKQVVKSKNFRKTKLY